MKCLHIFPSRVEFKCHGLEGFSEALSDHFSKGLIWQLQELFSYVCLKVHGGPLKCHGLEGKDNIRDIRVLVKAKLITGLDS